MMRIVLDTNVVVSGLLWRGPSRSLFDAARLGRLVLFTSPALIAELADVLGRPKFQKRLVAANVASQDLVIGYASLAVAVTPAAIGPTVLDDPDDDEVLACAWAAKVDMIVSGDRHLLSLGTYLGIVVLPAAEAIARLAEDGRGNTRGRTAP